MQIKITGEAPAGFTTKIKEVAAEFDLVIDEESSTPEGTVAIEFSKHASTGEIHVSESVCTSCEG